MRKRRSAEDRREERRRYYARHRDEIRARWRAAYHADPEPRRRRARDWYAAHREQAKAAARRYHWAHRQQCVQRSRKYHAGHKQQASQRGRKYYAAHRQHILQRVRRRYFRKRDQCLEWSKRYRQANAPRILEKKRTYRAAHREQINDKKRQAGKLRGGDTLAGRVAWLTEHPEDYVLDALGIELRRYQREPLERILDSIEGHRGDTIVILFPRQSGKDELLLDLLVYLADLYATERAGIVVVNPTFRPQTVTALERFDAALDGNPMTHSNWRRNGGFMRLVGKSRISFLSGDAHANVAGATASLLLMVNEAQDIAPQVYYQKFVPMAASINATRILAGTAWTSQTLLAQEMRIARRLEQEDGRRRVFTVDADEVRAAAPWYGQHVDAMVAAHGREHPLVKTQYFNEEIDAQMSMFNSMRMGLMESGDSNRQGAESAKGNIYAFCIDVAGQDEASTSLVTGHSSIDVRRSTRDSTTLSILHLDLSTLDTLHAPTYRVVHRQSWTGLSHVVVYGQLKALAEQWRPQHMVIDATGVGEGLWSLLDRAFPLRVIPVKFSASKKSEIGYRFLSIIETGRFRAFGPNVETFERSNVSTLVRLQYLMCRSEILPGPMKTMRWGVPEGTRDADGALVHDDFVLADSLVAELDRLQWTVPLEPYLIQPRDPLADMSRFGER